MLALVAGSLVACQSRDAGPAKSSATKAVAQVLTTPDARDIHSHADPAVARVTHVMLELTADFEKRTMQGTATLEILAEGAEPLLSLDTSRLNIQSVRDGEGKDLTFRLEAAVPVLGSAPTTGISSGFSALLSCLVIMLFSSALRSFIRMWLLRHESPLEHPGPFPMMYLMQMCAGLPVLWWATFGKP